MMTLSERLEHQQKAKLHRRLIYTYMRKYGYEKCLGVVGSLLDRLIERNRALRGQR